MRKSDKRLLILVGGLTGLTGLFLVVALAIGIGTAIYLSREKLKSTVDGNIMVSYDRTVTDQEAKKLAALLSATMKKQDLTELRLHKRGSTYEVRFQIKQGLEADAEYARSANAMARMVSQQVFDKAPCDIIGCDGKWNDLRVYPGVGP